MATAQALPQTRVYIHEKNLGYGGNQKTCYTAALKEGADIIVMIHPDHQYTPLLLPAMAALIGSGLYHCVHCNILGSGPGWHIPRTIRRGQHCSRTGARHHVIFGGVILVFFV